MPTQFILGMRPGAQPIIGATLFTHYIANATAMTGICGHAAPLGWGPAGANLISSDPGQVTCGACLAALTRQNVPVPAA